MSRGKFITFEGIEGAGKSTHLRHLCQHLDEGGLRYVVTREPGGTPFGKEIRSILLNPSGPSRDPVGELLLYLADRIQDLSQVIRPALDAGIHVLCDRYHDATRAYQGFARGVAPELIDHLARELRILAPDLTVIFEVSPEVGLARALERNRKDGQETQGRFEKESPEFHRKVLEGYRALARLEPERFHFIRTDGDFEQAQIQLRNLIEPLLKK